MLFSTVKFSGTIFANLRQYICFTCINKKSVDSAVVVDGNIVTSRGPGTAIAFSLTMISLIIGKNEAEKLRSALVAI